MGLNPYRITVAVVLGFMYLDEVHTRIHPTIVVDVVALMVCALMGWVLTWLIVSGPSYIKGITRSR